MATSSTKKTSSTGSRGASTAKKSSSGAGAGRSGSGNKSGSASRSAAGRGGSAGKSGAASKSGAARSGRAKTGGAGSGRKSTSGSKGRAQTQQKEYIDYSLAWEIAMWVVIAISIILFISTLGFGGIIGKGFAALDFGLFGIMAYIFPFALFILSSFFISNHKSTIARIKTLGWLLAFITLCGLMQIILVGHNGSYRLGEYYEAGALYRTGGGLVGGALTAFFAGGVGVIGAYIVYIMMLAISLILITQKSILGGVKKGGSKIARSAKNTKDSSIGALRRFMENRRERLEELGDEVDSDTLYDPKTDRDAGSGDGEDEEAGFEGFSILPKERRLERKARGVTTQTRLSPAVPESDEGDVKPLAEVIDESEFLSPNLRIRGLGGSGEKEQAGDAGADREGTDIREHKRAHDLNGLDNESGEDLLRSADTADIVGVSDRAGSESISVRTDARDADSSAESDGNGDEKKKSRNPMRSLGSIFREKKDNEVTTSSGKMAQVSPDIFERRQPDEAQLREAARKADELLGRQPAAQSGGTASASTGSGAVQASSGSALGSGSAGVDAQATAAMMKKKKSSEQEIAEGISQVAGEIAQNTQLVKPEYHFPSVELLNRKGKDSGGTTEEELRETAAKLAQVFKTFGVNVKITDVTCGPSVTRYELTPEMGVKVSKILNLQDDIQLNLAVTDIRIEAPIPGKAAVGIEVPNKKPSGVLLRELLESEEFKKQKSNLTYAVGKDIGGNIIVADIARMPHLLIAGSTGSGKSVFINTLIMSILYKAKPEDVKLIMIDPKVVELSVYNGIPHLFIPVVTDPKKAAGALNWAVAEMMARYQKFADTGVRDLKGYNARVERVREAMEAEMQSAAENETGGEMTPGAQAQAAPLPEKMPQIVIIVDELADLMMVASSEVEDAICRLAQLARAAGIHLVIATQRPSVDVITGLIKANMPSRIAFAVSSGVDSRTILDQVGAEKLLGNGDMFFSPQTYKQPLRVQGAFVSDQEVAAVVENLKEQSGGAVVEQEMAERMEAVEKSAGAAAGGAGGGGDTDELFAQAGRFIIEKDKASIGMLQRWFKIGFNRAARIMDQLSDAGVVGPEEGTKPRKVEMSMEQFEAYLEQN